MFLYALGPSVVYFFLGGGPLQQIQAGSWKKDKDMEDSQKRREAEAAKAT
jgi:hypothetical protein